MPDPSEWKDSIHISGKRPDVRGLPIDEDVDRELMSHIEMMTEELIADGWEAEEAREHVLQQFGDLIKARGKCRSITRNRDRRIRVSLFLEQRWLDLKYAFRVLRKARGYSIAAISLLALGIGANTGVFSVVHSVLFNPLPYSNPDQLIRIYELQPDGFLFGFSPPNFESTRDRVTLLEDFAAYYPASLTLTGRGDPEILSAMRVSAGFFELLGVQFASGRSFTVEDDAGGAEPVVILSHSLWLNRFGGRDDLFGESITLGERPHTVIGVAPAGFVFVDGDPEVWVPCAWTGEDKTNRGRHWLRVLGRMRTGADPDMVSTELNGIAAQLAEEFPATNGGWGMWVREYREILVGHARSPLFILFGVVVIILIIACANVGNLSLARAENRGRELAVRVALGAGRDRITLQLLTESLLLALTGGLLGICIAYAGTSLFAGSLGGVIPRASEISVDRTVLTFTLCISVFSGILVGFMPAIVVVRKDLISILKTSGGGFVKSDRGHRLKGTLVVVEVASSLLLLIGAGLLLSNLRWLTQRDLGFDEDNLLTANISLPRSAVQVASSTVQFESLVDDLEGLPGVISASAIESLPLQMGRSSLMRIPGRPESEDFEAERRRALPGYFETMRIPLLAGRLLERTDVAGSQPVVVVNETFARHAFPGENAVGKYINFRGGDTPDFLIAGVVGDVQQYAVATEIFPCTYFSNVQFFPTNSMYLVIRTETDPRQLSNALRETVWNRYPDLPIPQLDTMEGIVSESLASERLQTVLLSVFAGVALILCLLGIYGVISYLVSQRLPEFGIRLAMGAGIREIIWMVLKQGLVLTVSGVVLGISCALLISNVLSSLLYGVSPTDPVIFISTAFLLTAVSAAACIPPAFRAAGEEPMKILRME